MIYLYFIFLRIIDIFTSYKCFSVNCSTELNPVNNFLIHNLGLKSLVFVNLFISFVILLTFYKTKTNKISKLIMYLYCFLITPVMISNIWIVF